jgi:hypothetical protein
MKLGRPTSFRLEDGNVALPLAVDDQYIINDSAVPRQPVGSPSLMSYFISDIHLSDVIHHMSAKLYIRRPATDNTTTDSRLYSLPTTCSRVLSTIIALDGQLESWWCSVPGHLKQESVESGRSWIRFQRQQEALKIRYVDESMTTKFKADSLHDIYTFGSSSIDKPSCISHEIVCRV